MRIFKNQWVANLQLSASKRRCQNAWTVLTVFFDAVTKKFIAILQKA